MTQKLPVKNLMTKKKIFEVRELIDVLSLKI